MGSTITCPHCHAENPENANFCEECATKLRQICDCWVKKEPYNCGHSECHGRKVLLDDFKRCQETEGSGRSQSR